MAAGTVRRILPPTSEGASLAPTTALAVARATELATASGGGAPGGGGGGSRGPADPGRLPAGEVPPRPSEGALPACSAAARPLAETPGLTSTSVDTSEDGPAESGEPTGESRLGRAIGWAAAGVTMPSAGATQRSGDSGGRWVPAASAVGRSDCSGESTLARRLTRRNPTPSADAAAGASPAALGVVAGLPSEWGAGAAPGLATSCPGDTDRSLASCGGEKDASAASVRCREPTAVARLPRAAWAGAPPSMPGLLRLSWSSSCEGYAADALRTACGRALPLRIGEPPAVRVAAAASLASLDTHATDAMPVALLALASDSSTASIRGRATPSSTPAAWLPSPCPAPGRGEAALAGGPSLVLEPEPAPKLLRAARPPSASCRAVGTGLDAAATTAGGPSRRATDAPARACIRSLAVLAAAVLGAVGGTAGATPNLAAMASRSCRTPLPTSPRFPNPTP
mmetsp:Transcript_19637/g.75376  ORF Transcript_19637/g.75376 Transcript_19637/m.75376 type:complete len:456 (+) Transcript_19637:2946-4313(+)